MVEFTLPKNSRMTVGKTWPKPEGAKTTRKVQIYRYVIFPQALRRVLPAKCWRLLVCRKITNR